MPSEEISDNGFACFSFCYEDVTRDNADFTDGLASLLYPGGKRGPSDPGKISIWAWAAIRAMDYIMTLDCIDHKNVGIVGHSRLGKTALWAAANDERFSFCFANESGCSGAALTRGTPEEAEHLQQICKTFPYWFCERYQSYVGREASCPSTSTSCSRSSRRAQALCRLRRRRSLDGTRVAVSRVWRPPASGILRDAPVLHRSGLLSVRRESFHEGYLAYHMFLATTF